MVAFLQEGGWSVTASILLHFKLRMEDWLFTKYWIGQVGVKRKGISYGFVVVMFLVTTGIAGCFYINEMRFIERSVAFSGEVISVGSVPRKRILKIKTDEVLFPAVPLLVAVPFWDKKKRGDKVRLRVDPNLTSHVKVDEAIYLHRTSVSILSGFAIILVIACGTLFLRKRSNRKEF